MANSFDVENLVKTFQFSGIGSQSAPKEEDIIVSFKDKGLKLNVAADGKFSYSDCFN